MKVAGKGKRRVPSSGEATGKRTAGRARAALWKGVLGREGRPSSALSLTFFPKQELLGSPLQKKKERAWRDGWHTARELGARGVWMGGTQLWSWGPAAWAGPAELDGWHAALVLDGWHAALELGSHRLDGRHAAQELGARMEFGTVWMGGGPAARSRSWGPAEFGGVARGSGTGGAEARGVWMGGTRLWSRAPAVLMHVLGTFNIDGLSAGWVTACTHIC